MAEQRRLYAATVLTGVATGALLLFAGSRTWAKVRVAPEGMPVDNATVTGSSAVPVITAMAFVIMAGSVAVVASSGRFRQVIGGIVALAGLLAAGATILGGDALDQAIRDAVATSTSMTGGAAQEAAFVDAAERTWWRWLALASGIGAAATGAVVVARGRAWPGMGRRYDAPTAKRRPSGDDDELGDLWKAMDEGEDPTA